MDDLKLYGPPGTGKTYSGLSWLEDRVNEGADLFRTAFVSYTNAAVDEAKDRLCERFGVSSDDLPYTKTVHALCKKVLGITGSGWLADDRVTEFGEEYGYDLKSGRAARGDDDLEAIREKGGRDAPYLKVWEFVRHRLIEDIDNGWEAYADYDPEGVAFVTCGRFRGFVEDYERWKNENALRDYTDLLTEFLANPQALSVSVAVVDECQDMSPLLWAVTDRLFARAEFRASLGDDDQCLYSYAGAVPSLMNNRQARHQVKLEKSYRLPRAVTRAALAIIEQNEGREPKRITPTDEEGEVGEAHFIEDLPLLNGESWHVLVRNWKIAQQIVPRLEEEGIPYRYGGDTRYSPWSERGPLRAVRTLLRLSEGEVVTLHDLWPLIQKSGSQRGDKPGAWTYGVKRKLEAEASESPERPVSWRDLMPLGMTLWGFERVMKRDLTVLTRDVSQRDLLTYDAALKRGTLGKPVLTTVTSVHGDKGREATNVVASTGCTGMTARALLRPWRIEEERRVAYVAATRAKKRLFVLPASPDDGVYEWDVMEV